jgi:hypothetical protein
MQPPPQYQNLKHKSVELHILSYLTFMDIISTTIKVIHEIKFIYVTVPC